MQYNLHELYRFLGAKGRGFDKGLRRFLPGFQRTRLEAKPSTLAGGFKASLDPVQEILGSARTRHGVCTHSFGAAIEINCFVIARCDNVHVPVLAEGSWPRLLPNMPEHPAAASEQDSSTSCLYRTSLRLVLHFNLSMQVLPAETDRLRHSYVCRGVPYKPACKSRLV